LGELLEIALAMRDCAMSLTPSRNGKRPDRQREARKGDDMTRHGNKRR